MVGSVIPRPRLRGLVDPLAGSVRGVLLLPDRHQFLERVDGVAAGVERLAAVRATHRHRHAHLADRQPAEAVDHRDVPDRPALPHLGLDLGELLLGHRAVGLVVEEDRDVSPVRSRTVPRNSATAPQCGSRTAR